jgi:hypothetical protein
MDDYERVRRVTAERRAMELVWALTNAVTGAPHWRLEAQTLLDKVEAGILPPFPEEYEQRSQEAA